MGDLRAAVGGRQAAASDFGTALREARAALCDRRGTPVENQLLVRGG